MFNLSNEEILKWQKHFKEHYGADYNLEETAEAAGNLIGLFEILLECDMKQNPNLYKKLKNEKR